MPAKSRRRGRNAGRAAVLVAALLLSPGHLHSQAPGPNTIVAPVLPLRQVAYIKASNAEAYDHLADGGGNQGHSGNSVALSADGNTMAVVAPYESSAAKGVNGNQNDNSTYASGAVYVFTRQGDAWTQQAYVKASNPGLGDHLAASFVLSRDGNTMAVAAPRQASATRALDGNRHTSS